MWVWVNLLFPVDYPDTRIIFKQGTWLRPLFSANRCDELRRVWYSSDGGSFHSTLFDCTACKSLLGTYLPEQRRNLHPRSHENSIRPSSWWKCMEMRCLLINKNGNGGKERKSIVTEYLTLAPCSHRRWSRWGRQACQAGAWRDPLELCKPSAHLRETEGCKNIQCQSSD